MTKHVPTWFFCALNLPSSSIILGCSPTVDVGRSHASSPGWWSLFLGCFLGNFTIIPFPNYHSPLKKTSSYSSLISSLYIIPIKRNKTLNVHSTSLRCQSVLSVYFGGGLGSPGLQVQGLFDASCLIIENGICVDPENKVIILKGNCRDPTMP